MSVTHTQMRVLYSNQQEATRQSRVGGTYSLPPILSTLQLLTQSPIYRVPHILGSTTSCTVTKKLQTASQ